MKRSSHPWEGLFSRYSKIVLFSLRVPKLEKFVGLIAFNEKDTMDWYGN